jgi:PAS domain S-box-containing protein
MNTRASSGLLDTADVARPDVSLHPSLELTFAHMPQDEQPSERSFEMQLPADHTGNDGHALDPSDAVAEPGIDVSGAQSRNEEDSDLSADLSADLSTPLPVASQVAGDDVRPTGTSKNSSMDASDTNPPVEGRKPTKVNILMVDDHPENLIALEATLYELDRPIPGVEKTIELNLVRATSGSEALRQLLRMDFAVILLDVQMPGMDGYEAATLIRQRPQCQHTPIIFLTAINTSETNVFKGYSLGAVDYLFKPYDPNVLRAKIGVFIDLYRKSQEIQEMADEAQAQAVLLRASNDELAKTNKIMGGLYRELERKSSELSKERDFIDKILETAGSYILIFTPDGKLERFNKASEDLSGYALEELRGKPAWEILAIEEDSELIRDAFRRLTAKEESASFDMRILTKNAEQRTLSITFKSLRDERGRMASIIASGIDITERFEAEEKVRRVNEDLERRVLERTQELRDVNTDLEREVVERRKAEIALKQAKEAAEFANSAKDQFLAVLSHELRTPLTPVLAIVQMLDEDPALPEELRTWVHTIGRNVQLEARLIDDLLDLTRIANGKLQLNVEQVETHRLVQETVAICQEDIKNKCLSLDLDLKATSTHVSADPARLQQVLWNLLKNAVKFTPEGGSITIHTSNHDGVFRCQVVDTGIGIPADHLARVFNAFDQGDKTITRRFGGLGLGLAISKALVDQHGGMIHAHSEGANLGSTFTIELPTVDPNIPPKEKKKRKNSNVTPGSISGGVETPVVQSTGRILLVEDNNDTSQAIQVLLERKGFTVLVAHTVQSAIEIAKTYPCDLVISDIGLPDGTGLEMIRKLNQIRPTRGIAMSGFGMEEDVQRSLSAGFYAHLVKPIRFEQLNEVLQQMLVQD